VNRFAALLDRLSYEPRRQAKLALLVDYFRATPDPERGHALSAITGDLTFRHAKAGLIRALIAERVDPDLFGHAYDYVGDLSETVALMWPVKPRATGATAGIGDNHPPAPTLTLVVDTLRTAGKAELPGLLAGWLDELDENGRWALLKLITGGLRVGVSARLAKTAVAMLGAPSADAVELVWHGLSPPYLELFAWVEGRGPKPASEDPAPFRPPMLAHPIEDRDFETLAAADFIGEWKWDGIRIQAVSAIDADGRRVTRLYSRTGEEITAAFPDLVEAIAFDGAIDGELLVVRDGRVETFNVLQQRLNRTQVSAKLVKDYPAHIRAYDLLVEAGLDVREEPFEARRRRLEALVAGHAGSRLDLSPLVGFATWDEAAAARADPRAGGAGDDADAVEGLMLKRRAGPYLPGRPKGEWFKWKRDPDLVDAVLMYAQRGHGKRSSFYSDYTFGVWRGAELVPVGKAYFGFTDDELKEIDRFVRKHTINRFGPVREVEHTAEVGLVFEIAFEGLQRSPRHKSGLAMRFPRIHRLRFDKRPADADRIETLEARLPAQSPTKTRPGKA
jgi:DNA ligase-1